MKHKLFLTVIVLALGGAWWYQTYQGPKEAVAPTSLPVTTNKTSENSSVAAESPTEAENNEEVVVLGTYVGLRDEYGGDFDETAAYLLINDGTEVVSVSLEPLLGTQKAGIESELGITRGDRLQLRGTVMEGEFTVSAIEVLQ